MVVLGILAASFFLLVYPYIVYPSILLLLPRRPFRPGATPQATASRAALLFSVYNEERSLPAKIENVRAIKKLMPALAVHAYTDCCTDRSVELLRAASDVITVHEGRVRTGKAAGMKLLVEAADADVVVFTDANVILEPESVPRLLAYFDDPAIGTVAGTLHYTNAGDSRTARTGSLYWRLEEWIKRLESDTGSTMGADGSIFAVRRSLYPSVPPNLLDDMIASMTPLFHGFRVVSAADVHAFERATSASADEFRRKRRIACRAFNTHRHLKDRLRAMQLVDKFKYLSHKYLRWFSAAYMLIFVGAMIAAIAMWGGVASALAVAFGAAAAFALALKLDLPLFGTLAEISLSILATGVGVVEAILGRTYQTWTPPSSR